MSLQNPDNKMSKSDENPNNYIMLLDDPKLISKKLKRAVTDSDEQSRIYFDTAEKPGVSNLLTLLSCATGRCVESLVPDYEDKMYGHLKKDTADAVLSFIEPVQQRYYQLRQDETALLAIMKDSAERASERAAITLAKAYEAIGFISHK